MYNQNWHPVTRVMSDPCNYGGDLQVTDAYVTVLRRFGDSNDPGAEIMIATYGEYTEDSNIVVTSMIEYGIRLENGDMDTDYEYDTNDGRSFTETDLAANKVDLAARARSEDYRINADKYFDWDGQNVIMRRGGKV